MAATSSEYDLRVTIDYPRRIVTTWYSRGKNAESTFDCFICLWIALNAALSVRFGRLGDRAKVMRFAEELASGWAGWLEAQTMLFAPLHLSSSA